MLFPTQLFNGSSIASIQELLLIMSEYITATITPASIDDQQAVLQAIQQTLFNILDVVNAYQLMNLGQQEYTLLQNVQGILPFLSAIDQNYINVRLNSFNIFSNTIYPLPLTLTANVNNLTNGQPALQSYDLTSYFIKFATEIPPVALSISNFLPTAQAMATAWLDALNYLSLNGNQFQLTSYNAVDRMYNCSQDDYNLLTNLVFASSGLNLPQLWNSLIAVPSILRVLALLYNDPSSFQSQAINAIKFVIFNLIYQTNIVLSSFSIPSVIPQPATAILRAGESLMDFANRTMGDYTQWPTIAAANDLEPPYIGTVPAPNIATPGQQLYLPPFSVNNLPLGSYTDAYLGSDIDFGVPGTTLTTWSGDFSLITGLNNYSGALIRRVLTPLGSLIFHPQYGSLLPQEVGSIQTANEAMLSASALKTALLQDPRTQIVQKITAYPANFGSIVMNATVQPYGNNTFVPFNIVIIPRNAG